MKIAIIGASGYAGGDIIRLLLSHPRAEVTCATSRKLAGKPLDSVHPHLKGYTNLNFENPSLDSIDADVAFLSVPHTAAMTYARPLLDRGIKVVDLSADYRLPKETFERVYGVAHTDYFEAPYGIPELHRDEYRSAAFVSNPGCFPTGATLAAAPLAPYAHTVIYDSKTGVSGAGDNPSATTHYPNVADNINPYKWTAHRHLAEMRNEISRINKKARCYFTPHLVPVNRGILTTAHILLNEPMDQETVEDLYRKFYAREYFVRYQNPVLAAVRGSNFCDIRAESEGDRVVVVSAIDNLGKGAAGQAIQNMNIICGFDERDGLRAPGLLPEREETEMKVREIMTRNPVTVSADEPVRTAAGLLRKNRIGGLPVMEQDTVVGVVTESDIISLLETGKLSDDLWLPSPLEVIEVPLREIVNWEKTKTALTNIGDTPVKKIMSHPPITIDEEADIEDAAALMLSHKIARLPVVQQGRLTGIVAKADIIRGVGGAID